MSKKYESKNTKYTKANRKNAQFFSNQKKYKIYYRIYSKIKQSKSKKR